MINKLKKIFNDDQIYLVDNISGFDVDFSNLKTDLNYKPVYVVRPKTLKEIRDLVLLAKRFNFSLTIRGSGTSFNGSSLPDESVVIDMSFFSKIKKVNSIENFVEVEANVLIHDLNLLLNKINMEFPFFNYNHSSTVAGFLSNNSVGIYSNKFNNLKDYFLSAEYVDGNGRIFYLHENNSFIDLINSKGSFAVITKLRLKIVKKINKINVAYFDFLSIKELLKKVDSLKKRYGDKILSIDFISKTTNFLFFSEQKYKLFVEFDVNEDSSFNDIGGNVIDKTLIHFKNFIGKYFKIENSSSDILNNFDLDDKRKLFKNLFIKYRLKGQIISFKFNSFNFENYYNLIKFAELNNISLFGKLGYGVFYYFFDDSNGDLYEKFNSYILELDGSFFDFSAVLAKNFLSENEKQNFCRLKYHFDPDNILNKNKVVDRKYYDNYKKSEIKSAQNLLLGD